MSKFSDLIQEVIIKLRQEPGVSVQQYAEDVIAANLQTNFNSFFDNYWWPLYTTNAEQFTLNGTTGEVTEDITNKIKRMDDIRYVWYGSYGKPLAKAADWVNPAAVTTRIQWQPTNSQVKIFRIIPVTTTGTIRVTYRTKPDKFVDDSDVFLDDDLLINATCFSYLSDDDDNQNAIKKFAEATSKRESQLRQALNSGPVPFGNAQVNPLTEWMTWP